VIASSITKENIFQAVEKVASKAKSPTRLTISQWADKYRKLSKESSAEPGVWRTTRAPYQKEIMNTILDDEIEEIVVMTSSQVGKTELLNNVVGYFMHREPSPMILVQPTLELAQAWSKDRFAPMIRDTKPLSQLVRPARARDSGNTMLHKIFPGGHLTACGANSPASLAMRPVRLVLLDEVDRYPISAGTEGDPVNLAKKRMTTFWNRKCMMVSTPTIRGGSRIEKQYEVSDRRIYKVRCPKCKGHSQLLWGDIQIDFDEVWNESEARNERVPVNAEWKCGKCEERIPHSEKAGMVRNGFWEKTGEPGKIAGFHLSELYSPWVTWLETAESFILAKRARDSEIMKTFVNTCLGETFVEEHEKAADESELFQRREKYAFDVPDGVLFLTASVDVQKDRLEFEVKGWGDEYENWSIMYGKVVGDTSGETPWKNLDMQLLREFKGREKLWQISCVCVDSGYLPDMVYRFCKGKLHRRVIPIKGSSVVGAPILASMPKTANRYGVKVFSIGVDTAKNLYSSMLKVAEHGPRFCHFPEYDSHNLDFFKQLTSEEKRVRYVKGFAIREWAKISTSSRNEAWDLGVYNLAAVSILNPNWTALKGLNQKKVEKTAVKKNPAAYRRFTGKQGFVNKWHH